MDKTKVSAELEILRDFIDFLNSQVGVYCDCLSGFAGNKVRVERQVARILRPTSMRIENGVPVIVHASVEDPASPDVIHHRIIRADDFIQKNGEASFNEQQICWSIITFIFSYWDEVVRPKIAKIRGVKNDDVKVDAFGDLRLIRNEIVHNKGIMAASAHARLSVLASVCTPDQKISPSHDQMHKLLVSLKQGIASLILAYTDHLPGAPKSEDIIGIAIQRTNRGDQ